MPSAVGLLFAVGLLLPAACGGSTRDDTDVPQAAAELDAACTRLTQAMCRRRTDCQTPSSGDTRYPSEESCQERSRLACLGWGTLPGSSVATESVTGCAAEIDAASCRDVMTLFYSWSSSLPWCLPAGERADGEPCVSDAQCQSRRCPGGCGKCTPVNPNDIGYGHAGDACDRDRPCLSFLTCEAGTCAAAACLEPGCYDFGRACGSTIGGYTEENNCPLGTSCENANDLGRGRCMPYAIEGEACTAWAGPACWYPAHCVDDVCRLPEELDCR